MSLFFVTDRADAHVARFDALFSRESDSYELIQVSYGETGEARATVAGELHESWSAIRDALSTSTSVVISGPLDSVSVNVGAGDFAHLGISFATDVMVTAAESSEMLLRLATLVRTLDCVVTDNYATENALISLGAKPESILRIPWGPEAETDLPPLTRDEVAWPKDRHIILYPRSLEPHYDPEVFVDALARVVKDKPEVLAVFVETGSLVQAIRTRIARAGLEGNVHFEPLRPAQEFRSMMPSADLVVVTPRTDGTSVTVLDAMAVGIPVVSSLTAGSAEWVIDGVTGWTFPVGDAEALAHTITRALDADDAVRSAIVSHAKELVTQKAGWDSSAGRLREVIHRLIARH